ncbi:TIGR02452 family protein [Peterkaempfera griseoplana]|uniref:TIGR02452 family protein n=1 Tax=Peterkaempfera griseoplana TaxID=66896 RepID=UPI0006E2CCC4|nr:TIGR02452 family protein [Peterkaempfera griseoplana]
MSARLRGIARETVEITEAGRYRLPGGRVVDIGGEVAAAVAGTRLYGPGPVDPGPPGPHGAPVVEVTGESSLQAARRMLTEAAEPVAVLDFASARNAGGGFLNGAQAQEEALCRSSALHACLRTVPDFYAAHRADSSPFYSDRVIHAPAVPVFRDDRGALLEQPYPVDFLVAAAPNAGVVAARMPDHVRMVPEALRIRAERVLETAAACGLRRLVLGAWGCGVFRNDPAQVAAAFHGHLAPGGGFGGRFGQVVFAVLDRRPDSPVRAAFRAAFGRAAHGPEPVPFD